LTVYVFDVDGTLEVSGGPIKLEILRKLRAYVFIVGNYAKLAETTTEFPNGNPEGLPKEEALRRLGERFAPQEEKIYVGDDRIGDREAALKAGWKYVHPDDFKG